MSLESQKIIWSTLRRVQRDIQTVFVGHCSHFVAIFINFDEKFHFSAGPGRSTGKSFTSMTFKSLHLRDY